MIIKRLTLVQEDLVRILFDYEIYRSADDASDDIPLLLEGEKGYYHLKDLETGHDYIYQALETLLDSIPCFDTTLSVLDTPILRSCLQNLKTIRNTRKYIVPMYSNLVEYEEPKEDPVIIYGSSMVLISREEDDDTYKYDHPTLKEIEPVRRFYVAPPAVVIVPYVKTEILVRP